MGAQHGLCWRGSVTDPPLRQEAPRRPRELQRGGCMPHTGACRAWRPPNRPECGPLCRRAVPRRPPLALFPPFALKPGERLMKLAEDLYQAGYLSYPRTETDVFDPGMDLLVGGGLRGALWVGGAMGHAWLCGGEKRVRRGAAFAVLAWYPTTAMGAPCLCALKPCIDRASCATTPKTRAGAATRRRSRPARCGSPRGRVRAPCFGPAGLASLPLVPLSMWAHM